MAARFLIDANLPRHLAIWHGAEFAWVVDHDENWPDSSVWSYAQANDPIIVTKDADYSDRIMLSSPPPRVVHVRVGNLRMKDLRAWLIDAWPANQQAAPTHKLPTVHRDTILGVV